ncbi:CAP domain-containing protein [Sphingomonas sp. Xoc002]|uniref:CAP domain-containing protein n=1 Tax=Sphingomonas sp. Xoc002 TaxID=2837624 RepID=UPI003D184813
MMCDDMAAMRTLRHLLSFVPAVLLLAACGPVIPSQTGGMERPPPRVVEQRTSDAPASRGAGLLRQAMLDGHRTARADMGLPPLAWDEGLAASALAYAQELARTGRFQHAEQPQGPTRQGENLWTGTRGAYRYDEMMGHWLAERRNFVNLPVPQSSRTGQFGDVGHYSQIVWARSTAVGCAMASNARDDFLVCRYSPTGNVFGERAF